VPGGIYGEDATRRTYARLRELAALALAAGQRVVVDAAFLRRHERDDFRRLAQQMHAPFTVLHCDAPPEVLRERVRGRSERRDDASEAGLEVLDRQRDGAEPLQPDEGGVIAIDTSAPLQVGPLVQRWLAAG